MSDFIQCHFLPDLPPSHPNRNHNRCFSPALSPALPLITFSSVFPQEMRWNLRFATTCFMVASFGWTLSSGCVDTSLWFQPSVSLWQWKSQGASSHPPQLWAPDWPPRGCFNSFHCGHRLSLASQSPELCGVEPNVISEPEA